jgi:hypothetical protein
MFAYAVFTPPLVEGGIALSKAVENFVGWVYLVSFALVD